MASEAGKSFARRDCLREIDSKVQKWGEEKEVFRAEPGEKFFGNFPFPYMNGYLHLGHAFSLSKLEFAAAFHPLRGTNVLLPFAFHCTAMPIKASADKLAREIQPFGNPPVFPTEIQQQQQQEVFNSNGAPPDKFKGSCEVNGTGLTVGDYAQCGDFRR
ncbi:Leucine--tRNA ligase [Spatholobus suberectus]|nr:Leucine--tRNA ligase [Spatholobus suberectus]